MSSELVDVLPVFASYRLFATHLFACIPIAIILSSQCKTIVLNRFWHKLHRYAILFPVFVTLAFPDVLKSLAWTLQQLDAGFPLRTVIRCSISILIVFSWFAAFPIFVNWQARRAWLWTMLLCTVFPAIFGWKQAELCRDEFGSGIAGMRVSQASHALNRLVEISGAEMHQGISLLDWRSKLTQEIAFIRKRLTNPFPKNPSTNDYLERATQLLSLSRYAEAEQLLLDASSSAPQVLLLLAISAREQKEYQKLEMRCRALLDLSSTSQTSASRVDDSLVFQLLGESFIGQRKIKAAIATYEMAIQRDEPDRAELEMRLGSLLAEAGDASGAAEHFEQAARIDRNLTQQANKRIRGLQSNSCKF
ncbi:MAG: hypothetical protein NTY15_04690 [Planctomycetota bacterium]|nr:hypothetical protein [Planctomycetota bacterium]